MSPPYPWQQVHWCRLLALDASGRLPHALLVTGPVGADPLEFARRFATYLMCEGPANARPCGQCKGCRLAAAGSHPDLAQLQPPETGKAIRIDQVRAVGEFVTLTRQRARWRVVIVHPAEQLNIHAANSLLKTLEEPAPGTMLMLVSHLPGQLPATVRSRCQLLPVGVALAPVALDWLAARHPGCPPERYAAALAVAGGLPLGALAMLQEDVQARRRQRCAEWEAVVCGRDEPVTQAQEWDGEHLPETLEWLACWCEDAIRLKMTGDPGYLRNRDLADVIGRVADRLPLGALFGLRDRTGALRLEVSGTQVNPRMALEALLGGFLTAGEEPS